MNITQFANAVRNSVLISSGEAKCNARSASHAFCGVEGDAREVTARLEFRWGRVCERLSE
jgi:hypothetical protein